MDKKNLNLIRYLILKNSNINKEGHVASSFSILEILYIIFKKHIKKNYFVLSKGHASIGLYAIMFFFKYISKKVFYSFCNFRSKLGGHPDSTKLPLLNFSTGSLGHGLPCSVGLAYALKKKKIKKKVICLVGDQELVEGTTWESFHIIENYKIDNLTVIIDRNNSDFRSIKFFKLKKKLLSFSSNIFEINGNDLSEVKRVLNKCINNKRFNVVIANTVKGYGIKLIQNNPAWHHKQPSNNELEQFKIELKV